ncbi:hypothetical protein BDW22DRAFT_1355100 [Trametopsis cervina]|nr:hypothetical protein BDW22DRAFT_1355100 [Trametopsis cervina]
MLARARRITVFNITAVAPSAVLRSVYLRASRTQPREHLQSLRHLWTSELQTLRPRERNLRIPLGRVFEGYLVKHIV